MQTAMRPLLAMMMILSLITGLTHLDAQPASLAPEHAKLKDSEGTWDATIKTQGGESKGTLMCKLNLNGLWLLEHFTADLGGMPFEGHGATTYNPAKKKYVNVWIDSMNTSPMISEGTYDQATRTMTLLGEMPTPDGKSMKAKLVTVAVDANTKNLTITGIGPDGKDFELIQITYKRSTK